MKDILVKSIHTAYDMKYLSSGGFNHIFEGKLVLDTPREVQCVVRLNKLKEKEKENEAILKAFNNEVRIVEETIKKS